MIFPRSRKSWHRYLYDEEADAMLRSLSHVNQRLRQFTLPILWADVIVRSIRQLGKLHEQLRVSPIIADHIKLLRFRWDLFDTRNHYDDGLWMQQGTLLAPACLPRSIATLARDERDSWLSDQV